jgi:hypothetical protein
MSYYDHVWRPIRDEPGTWYGWKTTTTDRTYPMPVSPTEEDIRRIVRKEIAKLPIKYDVPDSL